METSENLRADHRALIGILLMAIESQDIDTVLHCLHDDVRLELPFDPCLGPLDKRGVERMASDSICVFKQQVLQTIQFHEMVAPGRLAVECISTRRVAQRDLPPTNRRLSIFEFAADNRVIKWLEFSDPLERQVVKAGLLAAPEREGGTGRNG